MTTLLIALVSISFLYFLLALIPLARDLSIFHGCIVCASTAITAIVLLILYLLGYAVDPVVLALLMGGIIIAAVNWFRDYFSKKGWKKFLLTPWLVVILGLVFFWVILNELWFWVVLLLIIIGIGALILRPTIFKPARPFKTEEISNTKKGG